MAFCKNCGAELNEGAKFCKLCGTPVSGEQTSSSVSEERPPVPVVKKTFVPAVEDDDDDDYAPASSPFSHDKKRTLGGIWGLVLPVVLVLIGVAVYGLFKGTGSGDPADGSESSASEQAYRPNILPKDNNYSGLWVSSGVASFAYQNISGMDRRSVAQYIEQQMTLSDHVRYLMTDRKISVLVNGNTSLSGEYAVKDNDDLDVVTSSGERDTIWMYVTNKNEFYTYIRYTADDGTVMCSAMKMKRNR